MAQLTRFGRKIALPSTRQIRHELLVMMAEEAKLKASRTVDAEPAAGAAAAGASTAAT